MSLSLQFQKNKLLKNESMKMFSNKKRFNGNHLISDSIDSGEAFSLVVWRLRTTNFWSAGQELLPPKAPVQSFPNTFSARTLSFLSRRKNKTNTKGKIIEKCNKNIEFSSMAEGISSTPFQFLFGEIFSWCIWVGVFSL